MILVKPRKWQGATPQTYEEKFMLNQKTLEIIYGSLIRF